MKFIDTFKKHRNEFNKSLESYIKEVRVGLGQEIADRKKVYLDTKYWLLLRDVVLERTNNKYLNNLLLLLREKVHDKYLICPISEEIFIEILKQSDSLNLSISVSIHNIVNVKYCLRTMTSAKNDEQS